MGGLCVNVILTFCFSNGPSNYIHTHTHTHTHTHSFENTCIYLFIHLIL
jgi:hypothetical protein